ncbi:MAG: toxin-antitoxin system YwqK family antitoxin [Verrucomicrobia bacterium]|nr:toxin-antitoxin system YwqK family antitoxin [Verrucomicrobiota bacterium]
MDSPVQGFRQRGGGANRKEKRDFFFAKSSLWGKLESRLAKMSLLNPKIFWLGLLLAGVLMLGMGRAGETIPASELGRQGDLFYRKGEKGPFTGTVIAQGSGKKTESEFREGRMDGVHRSWYSNGQIESEARFERGVRDGWARLWSRDGRLLQEAHFENGLADGRTTEWYPNGKMQRRTSWQEGKREGSVETWFESGNKKGIGNFSRGKRDGAFVVWWENGKKRQESNYQMGVPNGWWVEWDEDGETKRQTNFEKGKATEGSSKGRS